ncbi:MAG: serine/threonine-protein kinase [Planctomycetota bacterium]
MGDLSGEHTLGGTAGAPEKWSLAQGDTLGGYRVVNPLGRGGMGEVYLAENVHTRVRFALKLLPASLAEDSTFRERFAREAAVLQTLRHDGIVMVHHMGEESGRFFLTMDYVEGGPLDDRLKAKGKLAEEETARIALELCEALAYAHGKGVIHRDIKPANVLLDSGGRAKLSDFGLARVVGDDFLKSMTQRSISLSTARTGGGLSQSDNAVIGTYEYMSPEQKAGRPADERSDIFSLGLMVYRILTGEKAEGMFDLPSDLGHSAEWDDIARKSLAPKPERRYAGVGDLAGDVKQAAERRRERKQREATGGDALGAKMQGEARPSPSPSEGQTTTAPRKVSPPRGEARSRRVPTSKLEAAKSLFGRATGLRPDKHPDGDWGRAAALYERAARLCGEAGDKKGQGASLHQQAYCVYNQEKNRETPAVRALFRRAADLRRAGGDIEGAKASESWLK